LCEQRRLKAHINTQGECPRSRVLIPVIYTRRQTGPVDFRIYHLVFCNNKSVQGRDIYSCRADKVSPDVFKVVPHGNIVYLPEVPVIYIIAVKFEGDIFIEKRFSVNIVISGTKSVIPVIPGILIVHSLEINDLKIEERR